MSGDPYEIKATFTQAQIDLANSQMVNSILKEKTDKKSQMEPLTHEQLLVIEEHVKQHMDIHAAEIREELTVKVLKELLLNEVFLDQFADTLAIKLSRELKGRPQPPQTHRHCAVSIYELPERSADAKLFVHNLYGDQPFMRFFDRQDRPIENVNKSFRNSLLSDLRSQKMLDKVFYWLKIEGDWRDG